MHIVSPKRVSRSYRQTIAGTPETILPLYCPVREAEWIAGWDPVVVMTETGAAEPDCVFATKDERGESIWYVTRHSLEDGQVEMIKFTPGVTACRLEISLERASDTTTWATVTYTHTSLGPDGDAFLEEFTPEYYEGFMQAWEESMNHFLATGEVLD